MRKMANRWEAQLSTLLPYLQWSELVGGRTDTWDISRHNHASYELHIILDGECKLFVNNQEVYLRAGQGIMIAPDAFHAPNGISPGFLRFSLLFFPDSALSGPLPDKDGFLIFDITEQILSFCSGILYELRQPDSLLHKQLLSSQFAQLMIHVLRAVEAAPKPSKEHPADARQLDDMMAIDRFFVSTPPKQRTKENLAKLLHCSERQLLRRIRTLYGVSFREKQTASRIDTAQHLLRSTEKSIDEISDIVGYSDNAAFYRAFRLYTKTTPSKYRKQGKI